MTGLKPTLMRRWFIGGLIIATTLLGGCSDRGPADTALEVIGVTAAAAPAGL